MSIEEDGYKEVRLGPQIVEIPQTWQITRIQSIANLKSGYAFKSEDYTNKGIFILRSINISESGQIDREKDAKFVPRKFLTKYDKFKMKENDIVVVMVGASSGKLGLVQRGALPALLNQNMWRIRPSSGKAKKKFLYYLLEQNMDRFLSQKVGSARSYLKKKDFKKFSIAQPPLPEQKKIAEVLSTVDEAIQKTEEIIERTKEFKKGLMQDLLTKGIGHEEFKEVQLGPKEVKIPSDWVLKPLQEILKKEESGVWGDDPEEGSGVPVLRATNYGEYGIDLEEDTAKRSISDSKDGKKLEKGDIVLERSGGSPYQPVGRVLYFDLEGEFYPGNFLQLLRPDPAKIDPKFLFYRLDYIYEKGDTLTMQTRTTNIRNLQYNLYLAQKVPIPPITEQNQIADALSTVDQKVQQEQEYKEKLEKLKKGLMQDLLTGKVRVLPLLSDEEKEELEEADVPG